ncbi:Hypothetical_protein [Hexamita inflata]|uniref:Hypothetical_protein n=1 Tax=Hexamita inflata TaxID=28002 RepID=A0AA86UHW9_9EUKA|nr:Hypothetical protein HINF_LOCUS28428 [Hexamita inflata]
MNQYVHHQIIQGIAQLLQLDYSPDLEHHIITQVLQLPLINQLFTSLSQNMNVDQNTLYKHFNNSYKFKCTQKRTQPEKSTNFKQKFEQALKTVLSSYNNFVLTFKSDSDLCEYLNQHFRMNGQMNFWPKMNSIIPEKNEKQLREYYQKSFQRCMYQECITELDKTLLCKLIDQMQGQKPAVIANRFFEHVGTEKYFKRNVIMYIVNRKNK